MTQAAIIISVIAFASGSLATIAIYVDSPIVGISCAVALVVIVYFALCLDPCSLSYPAISLMEPSLPVGAPMGGMCNIASPTVVPLVLQVSPLPGSSDREDFFYNPSPDNCHGPIAAAHEFFLVQGHVVIIHTCPDFTAFQAVRPLRITLRPLSNLLLCVFTKGYARLQELAMATAITAPKDPPASHKRVEGVILDNRCTSLINHYADIPSVSLLAVSWPSDLLPGLLPVVGAFPGHPSAARVSYDGSHPSRWLTQRDLVLGSLFPPPFGLDCLFIRGTPPVSLGLRDNTTRSSLFGMRGPLSCQCNAQGLFAHSMGGSLQALPRITLPGTSMYFLRLLVLMRGSHMQMAFLLWCTAVSHMTILSMSFPMCRHQLGRTRVSQVRLCVLWHMMTYVCPRPRM
jgi:hypothetical protein